MTKPQWKVLCSIIKERCHFAFFDVAYQGLGTAEPDGGLDDIWAVRYFAKEGVDMLVCQSFSKSMGLYSERVGVLHVVCTNTDTTSRVQDALVYLVRCEFSMAPAYGARLAEAILENPKLEKQWKQELGTAAARLHKNRERLHRELTTVFKTPGDWDHILEGRGLFTLLNLSDAQVENLATQHHIYLLASGRINMAALNNSNIQSVARAIDNVIRDKAV
jgi:aspartate aminotransferase